jgi:nitrogen fixation/metabolism regulation signal transduction histidine kinase
MTVKTFRYLLLWSGLVAFPLAVILAFLFSRSLSVPLKTMRTMARAIASGDYTKRLEIPPKRSSGSSPGTSTPSPRNLSEPSGL